MLINIAQLEAVLRCKKDSLVLAKIVYYTLAFNIAIDKPNCVD